ncbi:hypothetical protein SNEBB_005976 [Seison nebaliae]|nr:hypothetical protein SNEBB_005976 [Seison nebaliae]
MIKVALPLLLLLSLRIGTIQCHLKCYNCVYKETVAYFQYDNCKTFNKSHVPPIIECAKNEVCLKSYESILDLSLLENNEGIMRDRIVKRGCASSCWHFDWKFGAATSCCSTDLCNSSSRLILNKYFIFRLTIIATFFLKNSVKAKLKEDIIISLNKLFHSLLIQFSNFFQSQRYFVLKMSAISDKCPVYSPFFGVMGATFAMVFTSLGAAYGTAKSGVGIAAVAVMHPGSITRAIIPIIMAGIVGIYGLVVAAVIATRMKSDYSLGKSFIDLGSGLSVGLSGLAAGYAIGVVGDVGVRALGQQPRFFYWDCTVSLWHWFSQLNAISLVLKLEKG